MEGRLLIKFPIRERRDSFLEAFDLYVRLSTTHPEFLITLDQDDRAMRQQWIWDRVQSCGRPVTIIWGLPNGKIDACNRDLSEHNSNWTTVLLASDDMHPIVQGYDQIILEEMARHFPENDGALWFKQPPQDRVNFVEVVGRKRYQQQGYLYNPNYYSLFADNEQTDKGLRDGWLARAPVEIIQNVSYHWGGKNREDTLYRRNNRYWKRDGEIYEQRKAAGFP